MASALPRRGQQRGEILDALSVGRASVRAAISAARSSGRDLTALSWDFLATVRLRQRVTKGPGSRAAGVAMAFKLIKSAQTRWRAVNAPRLVALVRAGRYSRTASSSNDPMDQRVVISKSRDTPIHRS